MGFADQARQADRTTGTGHDAQPNFCEAHFAAFDDDAKITRQRQLKSATAAYPTSTQKQWKYWPSVNRVDNVYGDRNFVCSCPPVEDYIGV